MSEVKNARIYTEAEKLAAIKREIGWRCRVYPRLIQRGKMTTKESAEQIAVFAAIEKDYEARAQGERLL